MNIVIPELSIEWQDEVSVSRNREELAHELNAYRMHLSPGIEGYRRLEKNITSFVHILTQPALEVDEYALYCMHLLERRTDVSVHDDESEGVNEFLQDDICFFLWELSETNPPADVLKRYAAMRQACAFSFFELRYGAEEAALFGAGLAGVFLLARWTSTDELVPLEEIGTCGCSQRTFATGQVDYRLHPQFLQAGYTFERQE